MFLWKMLIDHLNGKMCILKASRMYKFDIQCNRLYFSFKHASSAYFHLHLITRYIHLTRV